MDDLTRRRLENLSQRHRANAEREIETITALVRGLDLEEEPGLTLAQAERLSTASTALVRYLGELDGINDASGLMGAL